MVGIAPAGAGHQVANLNMVYLARYFSYSAAKAVSQWLSSLELALYLQVCCLDSKASCHANNLHGLLRFGFCLTKK